MAARTTSAMALIVLALLTSSTLAAFMHTQQDACTATALIKNGKFDSSLDGLTFVDDGQGDVVHHFMDFWTDVDRQGEPGVQGTHHGASFTLVNYAGHDATGHLHGGCHHGSQGGIQQTVNVTSGFEYKIKFKAFPGTWDGEHDESLYVKVTGSSELTSWRQLTVKWNGTGAAGWSDMEVAFTASAASIDINFWGDKDDCLDVDDVVLEQCTAEVSGGQSAPGQSGPGQSADSNRPVSKVISLLKDMLESLDEDQKKDEEVYDKMACWCETNEAEKTQAIAAAEVHITQLEADIESYTARSAALTNQIDALEKQVQGNQDALSQATEIRKKQNDEFVAEEKDLTESITSLKAAVEVLSKHQGAAFLQEQGTSLLGVAAMVKDQLERHSHLLHGSIKPSQRRALKAFVQQRLGQSPFLAQTPTFKQAYAPQSGEIYGILTEMLETFVADLAAAQKDEADAEATFQNLKTAKESEITTGEAQIDTKTAERAESDQSNVFAKQDLADTKASLKADEEYLMLLREKCELTDKEWEVRQKTRQNEIQAVTKALQILQTDDAHELFTKTFNPSFLQESSDFSSRRVQASALLTALAQKVANPKLSLLASKVQLDAFTEVKEAIDTMVSDLLKEKDDEIKHKDFCVEELNTNEKETSQKDREKEDELTKIDSLENTIAQLTKEIELANKSIIEMQTALQRASEDREIENAEFNTIVADQRETQELLSQAKTFLQSFYGNASAGSSTARTFLLEHKQEPVGPPPPEGFEKYEDQEHAPGVIGMLDQILADAARMEADAIRAEGDAQKAYEDFVKQTNVAIGKQEAEIVDKSAAKAEGDTALVQSKSDRDDILDELDGLSTHAANTHADCDFFLKNFDIRQTARDQEVEALRNAKSILSGSSFGGEEEG